MGTSAFTSYGNHTLNNSYNIILLPLSCTLAIFKSGQFVTTLLVPITKIMWCKHYAAIEYRDLKGHHVFTWLLLIFGRIGSITLVKILDFLLQVMYSLGEGFINYKNNFLTLGNAM